MNRADAYETMEREDLEQVQVERLQATLNRACQNVAFYRERFEAPRHRHREGQVPRGPRRAPLHDEGGPARELSLRDVRRAPQGHRAHPLDLGHHGQAGRRRLHGQRHLSLGLAGRARAAGRRGRPSTTSCRSPSTTTSPPRAWASTTGPRRSAPRWSPPRARASAARSS